MCSRLCLALLPPYVPINIFACTRKLIHIISCSHTSTQHTGLCRAPLLRLTTSRRTRCQGRLSTPPLKLSRALLTLQQRQQLPLQHPLHGMTESPLLIVQYLMEYVIESKSVRRPSLFHVMLSHTSSKMQVCPSRLFISNIKTSSRASYPMPKLASSTTCKYTTCPLIPLLITFSLQLLLRLPHLHSPLRSRL